MHMNDIAEAFRIGQNVQLLAPSLFRLYEMYNLIRQFGPEHSYLWDMTKNDTLEYTAKHLARSVERFEKDEDFVFHILERSTGRLVGCVGIHEPRKKLNYYSIGYWVGTEFMGRGYGSEACMMARDIAMEYLKPNRLEIGTAGSNIASQKIAEKAGFQLEATMHNYCRDKNGNLDEGRFYIYPPLDATKHKV